MALRSPKTVTLDDVLGPSKALGKANLLQTIRRRAAKRHAEAHGSAGEAIVAKYCESARLCHVARLDKIGTPTRGRPGRRKFSAKSIVDFLGFMQDETGRVVAIEVKTTTDDDRLALSRVDTHQKTYLNEVLGAGGIALIVAVFAEAIGSTLLRPRVYAVEWARICARKSVTERQLVAAGCATDAERFLESFLSGPSPRPPIVGP